MLSTNAALAYRQHFLSKIFYLGGQEPMRASFSGQIWGEKLGILAETRSLRGIPG